jgi:RimJ/RimL family protein N-acetyltransferase
VALVLRSIVSLFSRKGKGGDGAVEFVGEKVVLREKRVEDAADDYAWRCDPELAKFDGVAPLRMPFSTYLAMYQEELRHPYRRHRSLSIDDTDGKHIGNCMYYDIDENRGQAELGIMIGESEYWSSGYGSEAVNGLLKLIFTTTSLNRVYLHTLDWNIRAQRAFAKCGFVTTGEVVRNGQTFLAMETYRHWFTGDGVQADIPDNS